MPRDDVTTLLYTGGTTGVPKGAMITHKNLLYSAQTICYYERMVPEDVGICFMPLTHVFGQCHIMNSLLWLWHIVLLKGSTWIPSWRQPWKTRLPVLRCSHHIHTIPEQP
jgi:long-subunit acyl-CoA synthetase (AMP-forming)